MSAENTPPDRQLDTDAGTKDSSGTYSHLTEADGKFLYHLIRLQAVTGGRPASVEDIYQSGLDELNDAEKSQVATRQAVKGRRAPEVKNYLTRQMISQIAARLQRHRWSSEEPAYISSHQTPIEGYTLNGKTYISLVLTAAIAFKLFEQTDRKQKRASVEIPLDMFIGLCAKELNVYPELVRNRFGWLRDTGKYVFFFPASSPPSIGLGRKLLGQITFIKRVASLPLGEDTLVAASLALDTAANPADVVGVSAPSSTVQGGGDSVTKETKNPIAQLGCGDLYTLPPSGEVPSTGGLADAEIAQFEIWLKKSYDHCLRRYKERNPHSDTCRLFFGALFDPANPEVKPSIAIMAIGAELTHLEQVAFGKARNPGKETREAQIADEIIDMFRDLFVLAIASDCKDIEWIQSFLQEYLHPNGGVPYYGALLDALYKELLNANGPPYRRGFLKGWLENQSRALGGVARSCDLTLAHLYLDLKERMEEDRESETATTKHSLRDYPHSGHHAVIRIIFSDHEGTYREVLRRITESGFDIWASRSITLIPGEAAEALMLVALKNNTSKPAFLQKLEIRRIPEEEQPQPLAITLEVVKDLGNFQAETGNAFFVVMDKAVMIFDRIAHHTRQLSQEG